LTVLAYEPIRENGFVYDDELYIQHNPHVLAGLTGRSVAWAFTTDYASNWHPLTWLSLQLDHQLFGLEPWGYHLTNLLLHLANTVILLMLLWRMTGAWWRSALVAALFAVHPLHVESVAWVTERKDGLSTFFGLLSLWAYAGYVKRPGLGRYALVLLAYVASLLAKPMLVTLPFVLLLLDYWPLGRVARSEDRAAAKEGDRGATREGDHARTAVPILSLILEKVPLLLLAAASSAATWYAQQQGESVQALGQLPLEVRVGNALVAYVVYLRKMVWPSDLAAFYPHPQAKLPAWQIGTAAFLLSVLTFLVLWLRCKAPYLAVGWFWYLGTLVPVLGLVQVGAQAYADRYTYFPLIGIFLAITWGGAELVTKWLARSRDLMVGAAAIVVFFFALLTWLQVQYWRDGVTLWGHSLEVEPSALAHTNYASALLARGSGQEEEALAHLREAVQLEPTQIAGHTGLGILLRKRGQLKEAIAHLRLAARLDPKSAEAQYRLGFALGEGRDWPEAQRHLEEAIRLDPAEVLYLDSLAAVYAAAGQRDQAVATQRQALDLARRQGRQGYLEEAEQKLERYQKGP
jgi:tetratricopeptide (TPR) repeat protein